jgi:site-specific DNA-adenine methylase
MMSRASDANSFDHSRVTDSRRKRAYFKRIQELDLYYPTLEGVTVTQGDGMERLEQVKHDSNSILYLDPPYMPSEMAMKTANHYGTRSWTQADHERLVDSLLTVNGAKVVLSGYDHALYRRLEEAQWTRVYLKEVYVSSSTMARRWKAKYVWINFPLPPSLLEKVSAYDYGKW